MPGEGLLLPFGNSLLSRGELPVHPRASATVTTVDFRTCLGAIYAIPQTVFDYNRVGQFCLSGADPLGRCSMDVCGLVEHHIAGLCARVVHAC